jgi:hypothetical protein
MRAVQTHAHINLVWSMKLPRDEHHGDHVECPIAMVATRVNRLICVTKPTSVAQARRKAHIATARTQELTA